MRIGVVSDSHGHLYMLDKAIKSMGHVDMLIHLGDDYKDIIKINEKYKKPVEYVVGNNDYSSAPVYEKTITIQGVRIYITHGHKYRVKYGIEDLIYKAQDENIDVVLYGHTHRQNIERHSDRLFINPGALSHPADPYCGCMVLEIDKKGEVDVRVLKIEN